MFIMLLILASVIFVACVSEGEYVPASLESLKLATESEFVTAELQPVAVDVTPAPVEARNERDDNWIEDINFLRERIFMRHPLLRDCMGRYRSLEMFANPVHVSESYESLSRFIQESPHSFARDMTDADLQNRINYELDALIHQVPELEDATIIFELSRITSLLGDSHTVIDRFPSLGGWHPVQALFRYDGFYVHRILIEYEHLLNSRVIAINGVAIEDILEIIAEIIPHESEIRIRWHAPDYFASGNFLKYVGIIDNVNDALEYTLRCENGEIHTISVSALVPANEWGSFMRTYGITRRERDNVVGYLLMAMHSELNYWNEWLPDYNMMYVRFRRAFQMDDLSYEEFLINVRAEFEALIENGESIERLVIDIRSNGGGNAIPHYYPIAEFINPLAISDVYILIDNHTFSNGVVAAYVLRYLLDGAVIVGEPAGQGPNLFAATETYNLPNSGTMLRISTWLIELSPGYEWDSLMPDIYIRRTLEDHFSDRDTVLETIKTW